MEPAYTCTPMGDSALLIDFGGLVTDAVFNRVQSAYQLIRQAGLPGIEDLVPGYTTLTVFYDPGHPELVGQCRILETGDNFPVTIITQQLKTLLENTCRTDRQKSRTIEIPVCYEGVFAPDMKNVCQHTGLTPAEVIRLHSEPLYRVHFLGFVPGFPYLGGMNKQLATPRLEQPRERIPAGSVGIAGEQTGIYPLATPGGWQIIGHTPLSLVDIDHNPPALFSPGDQVRFCPVSLQEYQQREQQP